MRPEHIKYVANIKGIENIVEITLIDWENKWVIAEGIHYTFEEVECMFISGGFKNG